MTQYRRNAETMTSGSAILDVEDGRDRLSRRLAAGEEVTVTIVGRIVREHGNDDGHSREFTLEVDLLREGQLVRQ